MILMFMMSHSAQYLRVSCKVNTNIFNQICKNNQSINQRRPSLTALKKHIMSLHVVSQLAHVLYTV